MGRSSGPALSSARPSSLRDLAAPPVDPESSPPRHPATKPRKTPLATRTKMSGIHLQNPLTAAREMDEAFKRGKVVVKVQECIGEKLWRKYLGVD